MILAVDLPQHCQGLPVERLGFLEARGVVVQVSQVIEADGEALAWSIAQLPLELHRPAVETLGLFQLSVPSQ